MKFQVITFYEFRALSNLESIKSSLKNTMLENSVYGTVIIAEEGFNSTVCGTRDDIELFLAKVENIFNTRIRGKSSFHEEMAFKRQKVKIKEEIVTLRKKVDIKVGIGTHVDSAKWNELLQDPEMMVLDVRNDYEHRVGTFKRAVNPQTGSFNELPEFVEQNLDPKKHKKVAIFCTGGIRCEKFAPYLKEQGFADVYQLDGGILRYLAETSGKDSLWEGECFVFDERVSVDKRLKKGIAKDFSSEKNNA